MPIDDSAGDAPDAGIPEMEAEVAVGDTIDGALDSFDDAAPLDCTWVRDPNNCWRALVAEVDACLGNPIGATARGDLAGDGRSCTYPANARSVAFAIPATTDGPERDDRDFEVRRTRSGPTCLHYVEHAAVNGFVATSGTDVVSYEAMGNDVRVQCPDGTRYRGDALSISKLCGPAVFSGGAPGRTTSSTGGEVRLQLVGMKDVVYACRAPVTK